MNYYPTKETTRSIIIRSNSPNLTKLSESDVTFSLPETILIQSNAHCLLSITQVTLPITFWMIDSGTDKLIISGTTYMLGHGNYDAYSLTTHLKTILTGYTIVYSSIQNRLTLSHTNSFTIDSGSTCLGILGFQVSAVSATIVTGPNQVDCSGVKAVDISIKHLHTKTINTNFNDDSIVARVPISVPQNEGAIQQYEPHNPMRHLLPNFQLDELQIVLHDEDGSHNLIFHGGVWTVVIELTIVHSPRDPKIDSMHSVEKNLRVQKQQNNGVTRNENDAKPQKNENRRKRR